MEEEKRSGGGGRGGELKSESDARIGRDEAGLEGVMLILK